MIAIKCEHIENKNNIIDKVVICTTSSSKWTTKERNQQKNGTRQCNKQQHFEAYDIFFVRWEEDGIFRENKKMKENTEGNFLMNFVDWQKQGWFEREIFFATKENFILILSKIINFFRNSSFSVYLFMSCSLLRQHHHHLFFNVIWTVQ